MFDLVTVGHVAHDEFKGHPDWRLGGTALYAAATAARLGRRTALLTRVGPGERDRLAERSAELGLELHALSSVATTTFVHAYDDGRRTLRLRSRAKGLSADVIPAALRNTRSVVLGSVARELDASVFKAFAGTVRVLAAQGYLRSWDPDGTVRPRPWDEATDLVRLVDATVLSEEDIVGDIAIARLWSDAAPVIVTLAERGALVLRRGREVVVDALPADRQVDPTGAGDAFCAGLALALGDGEQLEEAARFANAVASFAIEDVGIQGLATREQVEARLAAHPLSSPPSPGSGKTARP